MNTGLAATEDRAASVARRGGAWLKFWGVRGSIPTPGAETAYYGGNTSCVEVRVGNEIIILDSGSGIRPLGRALAEEFKEQPIRVSVLITHTHWDHIQGFPFFMPAYEEKNEVAIVGFDGARQGLQQALSSQMGSPYFPINMEQMRCRLTIQEVKGPDFKIGAVPVRAQIVNHPGKCVGYRLATPGGDISFFPDVELRRRPVQPGEATAALDTEHRKFAGDLKVLEFIRDSEVLILDSQYSPEEHRTHLGWGHSCADDSVVFAIKANVKRLFLFHHDPDHDDEAVSRMLAQAREIAARRNSPMVIEAAREGLKVEL
jgi:phosphoribosyl 1,2-cyclic phosphodiesterase